jgi:hypothetical protein
VSALWKVYLPEWVAAYTSVQLEVDGQRECEHVYEQIYAGRVRDEDRRIRNPGQLRPGRRVLELRLPNLQGEFKDRDEADELRGERGDEAVVVLAGSPEERELSDYGRRMLPAE